MLKIFTFLMLGMSLFSINSQAQKNSFDVLRKIPRENLIQMAVDQINNDPYTKGASFDIKNFDRITVQICETDKRIWVLFDMSYKFIPLDSCYYYSILIDLNGEISSYGPICNSKDTATSLRASEFFKFNDEYNRVVQFVINNSDIKEKTFISDNKLHDDIVMLIYEKENYYQVEVGLKLGTNYYKIEKNTGRVYDASSDIDAIHFQNQDCEMYL